MLLFTTHLKINDTLTKDAFVQLVFEWNRTSKYAENRIENIEWNGEYSAKYGNDKLSLEFVDEPEQQIMAVRYEKITADEVVWDTDYVVNFAEKCIAIRLDRTYREDALIMNGEFSTPHFISLLIAGGYLAKDQDIPVLREAIEITDEDAEMIANVVEHKVSYQLPIVYVAKTADNQDVLDVGWLASRLKGAAHVLVEKDKGSCQRCWENCKENKEEYGAVRIYYPAVGMHRKRFLFRSAHGNSKLRLEKVIKNVIQYWNSQRMDILYTWQGVNNAILNNSLNQQISKYQEAENARANAQEEMELVYETFDEDLRKMQQRMDELTKANETLMLENSVLRAKLNVTEAMPIVYQGDEEDFYPEEIKDLILASLEEVLVNTEVKTRRADVIGDVLENNHYKHLNEERKQRIKALFKGYKNVNSTMRQELLDLGISITEDGKHYKLTYKDDPRYMVTDM